MAKRLVSTTICTNCLEEFVTKEMYTVARKMHRGLENNNEEYYAPYCVDCIEDTSFYLRIIEEPKIQKNKDI